VTIFDVLTVDDEPWLVLEYVRSEDLAGTITRGPLAPRRAAGIGADIAAALAAAHSCGIVHRDVKPANVLVGPTGQVKLADFGISRLAGDITVTGTGQLTGTPAYFASEICRGEPGGPASDVYSLGATLYAAVEGQPPFGDSHDNVLQLIRRIAGGAVPPPTRAGPLEPLLARLLHADPAARPDAATAAVQLRDIADAASETTARPGAGGRAPEPVRAPVPGPAGPARRRARVAAGAVAGVLALAGLLIGQLGPGGSPAAPNPPSTPGPSTSGPPTTGPPTTGPATPVLTLGADPHTADPCSLMDPVPLQAYGRSELDADYGPFSSCRIDVTLPSGGRVAVDAGFGDHLNPENALSGEVKFFANLAVSRKQERDGSCQRTVLLPDRTQVEISALRIDGAAADACAVAETATQSALAKLTSTGIGQRPAPGGPGSLALVDMCTLLDPAVLAAGGFDATPKLTEANWTCEWHGNGLLRVGVRRLSPTTDGDGQPTEVAGHTLFVLPGGGGSYSSICLTQVPSRRFVAVNGEQRVEKLYLFYGDLDRTTEEACRVVREVAINAVQKLPS
jgi:eukaryotic-like serine/threonine-protein kinase